MELTRRELLALGAGTGLSLAGCGLPRRTGETPRASLLLTNGRIATMDPRRPRADAIAIGDGRVLAVGTAGEIDAFRGGATTVLDLRGRTVVPGLDDSHIHPIRGGLNYNLELRWDGIATLGEALERLRVQARNTPPPQWVRVVGGWTELQFRERRLPTLDELNEAAPDTPVFVLHLYDRALLNRAALRALGYEAAAPDFDRGLVQTGARGRPTGLLVAKPSALVLYATLARGPRLAPEDQLNSTRHFMRELNRLGVTSAIDAGGGNQSYPEDYAVIRRLAAEDELTVRIGYDLFAQKPGGELDDYRRWVTTTRPGDGDDMLKMLGAGENLTWAAADFENFLEPRPDLPERMEAELEAIVGLLASHRWPFRIHATYDESIDRFLGVFERVHREIPLGGLHWFIDHAETISDRNIERVAALGGGIAVQHRMAFQGEYFVARYGAEAVRRTPPVRRMLELGVPVGAGTDATRVASYNPWVCLAWLVTGRTVGGTTLYPEANRLTREEALRLWTHGSAWFSSEDDRKGVLAPGRLADLAVLSKDYFGVPDAEIRTIESVLTVVGGRIVHARDELAAHAPPLPPASPDWSPVRRFGGAVALEAAATTGEPPALAAAGAHGPHDASRHHGLGCHCALA